MNDTKRKILDISLELLNEKGLKNVSQRSIASVLEISPGNLTYHFKKKEEIYEALYFDFIDRIEARTKIFLSNEISLQSYIRLIDEWFEEVFKYRFIFINLTDLIREHKKIADNYKLFINVRKGIFEKIMAVLIVQKIAREAYYPSEYIDLYERLQVASDFYLSYAAVSQRSLNKNVKDRHKDLFFSGLVPYLTAKGRKKFFEFLDGINWWRVGATSSYL